MITKEQIFQALTEVNAGPRDLTEVRMGLIELRSKIRRSEVPKIVETTLRARAHHGLRNVMLEHADEIAAIDLLIDALGEYAPPEPQVEEPKP